MLLLKTLEWEGNSSLDICLSKDQHSIAKKVIDVGLSDYNQMTFGQAYLNIKKNSLCFVIKNSNDDMVAGLIASMNRGSEIAWVDAIWVNEEKRQLGLGKTLLKYYEWYAHQNGFKQSQIEVYSFQSYDFFLKLGYDCIKKITNYSLNKDLYFLRRPLEHIAALSPGESLIREITQTEVDFKTIKEAIELKIGVQLLKSIEAKTFDTITVYASHENKIVGGVILTGILSVAGIQKVWIDESYRGKGLNTKIFQELLIFLKTSGYQEVIIGTLEERVWAVYEKVGTWERLGKIPGWFGSVDQIYGKMLL